jgi:hypothetical protein
MPVSWQFTDDPRLSVTLPKEFGGRTYTLPLEGGYTFAPLSAVLATA